VNSTIWIRKMSKWGSPVKLGPVVQSSLNCELISRNEKFVRDIVMRKLIYSLITANQAFWARVKFAMHLYMSMVKELVISWFFGFRSFFKMFLAGRMSHIRVRVMIWSVQNTTYSFNGLHFLKKWFTLT
jgi:hypothetical protein